MRNICPPAGHLLLLARSGRLQSFYGPRYDRNCEKEVVTAVRKLRRAILGYAFGGPTGLKARLFSPALAVGARKPAVSLPIPSHLTEPLRHARARRDAFA